MPTPSRPLPLALVASAILIVLGLTALRPARSHGSTLDQLKSELGAQQSRQSGLQGAITSLNRTIGSLDGQISLVRTREAAVAAELAADRVELAKVKFELAKEKVRLTMLRDRLALARVRLARQLTSSYESGKPDLMTVVLNANGFNDLLDQIHFLGQAEHVQQTTISITRTAKAEAAAAAQRLAKLQTTDTKITQAAALHERALAGMNALLSAKEASLAHARAAQQSALAASRTEASELRHRISHIEAAQAAAAARAAAVAATSAQQQLTSSIPTAVGPTFGPSGGWAIPYAIVLCESGGQNLTPNSAGASGYYQIIPSTWKLFGGSGPAAYLAPKSEQDAVATKIWNGGAGASNWVCAGIVGIH
ncbi:MAG: transglycosylase family protein [Solirubrobacteraceae bacterium]